MSEQIIRNTSEHMVHIPEGSNNAESKKSYLNIQDINKKDEEKVVGEEGNAFKDRIVHVDSSDLPELNFIHPGADQQITDGNLTASNQAIHDKVAHLPDSSSVENHKLHLADSSSIHDHNAHLQDASSIEDHKAHLPTDDIGQENHAYIGGTSALNDNVQHLEGSGAQHDNVQHMEVSGVHDRFVHEAKQNLHDHVATEHSSSLGYHHKEHLEAELNTHHQEHLTHAELKDRVIEVEGERPLTDRKEPVFDTSIADDHRETIPDDPHELKEPALDMSLTNGASQATPSEDVEPTNNAILHRNPIPHATQSTAKPQGSKPAVEELDEDLKRRMAALQKQVAQINEKLNLLA